MVTQYVMTLEIDNKQEGLKKPLKRFRDVDFFLKIMQFVLVTSYLCNKQETLKYKLLLLVVFLFFHLKLFFKNNEVH